MLVPHKRGSRIQSLYPSQVFFNLPNEFRELFHHSGCWVYANGYRFRSLSTCMFPVHRLLWSSYFYLALKIFG